MPRPPALLLIRHAQAEHLVGDLTGGSTDSELTVLGLRQARLLAARLASELENRPVHLGAGPLIRARHAAGIIGDALGVEARIYSELADLHIGEATGLNRDQARKIFTPPSEPKLEWRPYPGAENWSEFARRVRGFIQGFQSERTMILVTHRAVIEIIIQWWLGLEVDCRVSFDTAPASLSVLRINHWGERTLERLNDCAHLHAAGMPDRLRL